MHITTKPLTATAVALALLSACGGGGSTSTPAATPAPTPAPAPVPAPAPSPAPDPNAAFKDYQLPYLSRGQGIYTVPASTLSNPSLSSAISPQVFLTVMDGEWNNSVLSHKRPALLVFLDRGQWQYLTLRDADGVGVVPTNIMESRTLCDVTHVEDYLDPRQSVIIYSTPAADANGDCLGSKDEYHVFQLNGNRRSDVGTLRGGAALPRVFRGSRGEITAYVLQGQSNLILVKPDGSASTIASGVSGRAYLVARTADTQWQSWIQNGMPSLFRISSSGQVSSPLTSKSQSFFRGTADRDAIYLSHLNSDSSGQVSKTDTNIVSVSYNGVVKTLAAIHNDAAIIAADSTTALLVDASYSYSEGTDFGYFLVQKDGSSTVKLDASGRYSSLSYAGAVGTDRFLFNGYCFGCSGSTAPSALIYNSSGSLASTYERSQWIGTSLNDENFSDPSYGRAYRAGRLSGISESYNDPAVGHQGSTLLNQNFSTNTVQRLGSVDFPGYVGYALGLPADFLTLTQHSKNADGFSQPSNIDLFGIDLDKNVVKRLTNTPQICERVPYINSIEC